ncbi:MAG TPA: thiamine-phosphate kinase [Candidatus Competibacter sp.]|nr:thiamine-phosphate kinase [Candidatus Competibacteraceae bacterium]HRE53888.1 thiamine-phosphate kinase [Candidatus Competibacter sp.]HUM95790.1 thiamine-phosphate kinase [Candidatus Competibacter sp.]
MAASEFSLIERYLAAQRLERADVVLGIGDDGALLSPPAGQQLVVTLDTLVAEVHFFAAADPEAIGHKALAVNLSDLAAMGATPAWATLALVLPEADEAWLARFCQGLFALARRYDIQLVGGDTTHGPVTVIALQAHGFVPPGSALRRDGATPGDGVYVTGTPGDAGLALAAAFGKVQIAPGHEAAVRTCLERPEPRIAPGLSLRGIASAAIDVSDGLAQDLGHILQRSGVGAVLEVDRLPLSPALLASLDRDAAAALALASGDDYELCFTVPPERVSQLERAAAAWDCRCTRIGVITAKSGLRLVRADGSDFLLERLGYDHFR